MRDQNPRRHLGNDSLNPHEKQLAAQYQCSLSCELKSALPRQAAVLGPSTDGIQNVSHERVAREESYFGACYDDYYSRVLSSVEEKNKMHASGLGTIRQD